MPTLDFYLLRDENCLGICCRLLEKAYQQQHQVWALLDDMALADTLNRQLWQFRDTSFIPHALATDQNASNSPIVIASDPTITPMHYDILFNVSQGIPDHFAKFNRIIEIVSANETAKAISRQHYQFYKDQQCQPKVHQL